MPPLNPAGVERLTTGLVNAAFTIRGLGNTLYEAIVKRMDFPA
jgi:hypothetical protein